MKSTTQENKTQRRKRIRAWHAEFEELCNRYSIDVDDVGESATIAIFVRDDNPDGVPDAFLKTLGEEPGTRLEF